MLPPWCYIVGHLTSSIPACVAAPGAWSKCSIRSLILGNRTVWYRWSQHAICSAGMGHCGQRQRASIKGSSCLHAGRLERTASDAHADAHADAHGDANARGRGPFLVFIHHSVNPDWPYWATSTASGDAIPVSCSLLPQAGWFCAMTPRAATGHSLRHAALGTALQVRELSLWPPRYRWHS